MAGHQWLEAYGGQSAEELLGLASEYRVDSIVLAVESALLARAGDLNEVESTVLAVEAYEREVNNGGHHQFFINRPECAKDAGAALNRIGCPQAAHIAHEALKLLCLADSATPEAVQRALEAGGEPLRQALADRCDAPFFDGVESIGDCLFAYLKAHVAQLRLA
jgi:hypothetical protein